MTRWMSLAETWLAAGAFAERLDSAFAERCCLTLVHSLWQFGLLALAMWLLETVGRRLILATRYNLSLLLLMVGLAALPLTWEVLRTIQGRPQQVAFAASAREPSTSSAAIGAATPALDAAGLQAQPGIAASAGQAVALAHPAGWPFASASRWITAFYGLGVCLMLGRLVRGVWHCQRLMRKSQPITDSALSTSLSDIARRWKLRVLPRLAAASEVAMPCVMGLVRPTIIFPLAALSSFSPGELEMILAHELAHVRRRDLWAHLVQRLAEAVLFFNPGMWYVSRRISLLREYCCDELACERMPAGAMTGRVRYALALLHLAEIKFARSKCHGEEQLSALAAASGSPSQLRRRVAVLLGEPVQQPLRISRSGLLTLVLLIAVLFLTPALVVFSGQQQSKSSTHEAATSASEAHSLSEAPPVDTPFIETQSNGVKVKILAIGTRGERGKRWWGPDGVPLTGDSYRMKDFDQFSILWPQAREVVFTVESLPEGAGWRARLRPQTFHMGSGSVLDAEGNVLANHKAHFASLQAGAKSLNVEVGIAAGEWRTVASDELRRDAPSQTTGDVVFSWLTFSGSSDRQAWFEVSHGVEEQVRLVVIDKNGMRSPGQELHRTSADGKLFVSQFQVNIQRDEIERVEFQSRPYTWTTFDNLPARPTVESHEAGTSRKPAVKVLAIGHRDAVDTAGPRWWNPDGTPREAPGTKFNGRRNPQLTQSRRARQVVFELPDYHAGSAVRFEIKSKSGWSRGELTASELNSPEGQPKFMHEVHTISDDDETFTLRVGRADGEWKTVFSDQAGAVAQGNNELKGVVFSGAFVQNGVTAVAVSHNWHGQNARLNAIDKTGQKHSGKVSSHLTAVETVNQTIFEFPGLQPDDIAEFEFQVQDFTWTTIDNLPANPRPPADAKTTKNREAPPNKNRYLNRY